MMTLGLPRISVEGGRLRTAPRVAHDTALHRVLEACIEAASPASAISVRVELPCDRSWYLATDRTLAPVLRPITPPFPVGRFVVVDVGGRLMKWDFPWAGSFEITPTATSVIVTAEVRDPASCGLSLHGTDRLVPAYAPAYGIVIYSNALASLDQCVWIEPYPDGARAAICLTDHADFDTIPRMRLLVALFGRTGFRLTKSVFAAEEPTEEKYEPGLDTPGFADLCAAMRAQGSEIAFHGIGPRLRSPEMHEWHRRAELMEPFAPRTWIDHGKGAYLFSRSATLPDGSSLVDFLGARGVVNYWSYADKWDNPFIDLGSWRPRHWTESLRDVVGGWHGLRGRRGTADAMYLVSHGLKNLIGAEQYVRLRSRPASVRTWLDVPRSHRALTRRMRSPLVYGRDGASGFLAPRSRLRVFDTISVNHLAYQLSPPLVQRLVDRSELLLGHCYLGAQHRYITGNVFVGTGHDLKVDPLFVAALESIQLQQRERKVVSLPFAMLREYLDALATARLVRSPDGWLLEQAGGPPLTVGGRGDYLTAAASEAVMIHRSGTSALATPRRPTTTRLTVA